MKNTMTFSEVMRLSRECFCKVPDHRQSGKVEVPMSDVLMSALGIFAFKYPSLLKFDKSIRKNSESIEAQNFKSLFGVKKAPDDTSMRQTIDLVASQSLREPFKVIFKSVEKSGKLSCFDFYKNSYLLAIDGTGFFSSKEINCKNCCMKKHKDGTKTYYHQMLGAALIHPDSKLVVPFAPEPIQKQDGDKKNDCERNAVKRLLASIRAEHPDLDITITEDALSANYPHVKDLKTHSFHFILGIKPGGQKKFFDKVAEREEAGEAKRYIKEDNGRKLEYTYINDMLLKDDEPDSKVNFLELVETSPKGKIKVFSWITDFEISENNMEILSRGGRSRWRIENEVFNTLKNQGYQFEHNFGHGNNNLSTNFAMLMMLAFLADQVSELCNIEFQQARQKEETKYSLWEAMRSVFRMFVVDSWETLFGLISGKIKVRYSFDTC